MLSQVELEYFSLKTEEIIRQKQTQDTRRRIFSHKLQVKIKMLLDKKLTTAHLIPSTLLLFTKPLVQGNGTYDH